MTFTEEHVTHARDQRKESKARRARNRANGLAALRKAGVLIQTKNGGAHLIVKKGASTFDYWPGTGLWRLRRPMGGGRVDNGLRQAEGRGVQNLIQRLAQIEIQLSPPSTQDEP